MKKVLLFIVRVIALVKFIVKSTDWTKHYMATMLVALVMCGIIIVEVGKKHDAELERQRQAEMLEIAKDELVNQEVTRQ